MLGPMNKHQNESFSIDILDDSNHKFGLSNNKFTYTKYYFCESEDDFPVSRLGIRVFNNNKEEVASSIVIGFSGETDIYKNAYLIDSDLLLVCCCDTLICLSIPTLEINWKKSLDNTLCLKILKLEKDYLIYGRNEVTRIDGNGNIKKQYKNEFISFDIQTIWNSLNVKYSL